ncbi:hypothetical protein Apa02nite_031550 [Actinoplanes palleronii]|uniref:Uncharacterized protein n=1 Tax=Actinoplanes palleronii TaxID=113570 RepID=A0ABQ4B8X3_9ACTN|nr:hypothetical protein Apa02nite_031550 [Actinoplanes palleronii]
MRFSTLTVSTFFAFGMPEVSPQKEAGFRFTEGDGETEGVRLGATDGAAGDTTTEGATATGGTTAAGPATEDGAAAADGAGDGAQPATVRRTATAGSQREGSVGTRPAWPGAHRRST